MGIPLSHMTTSDIKMGYPLSTQIPAIGHEHVVSSLEAQIAHFMPKRGQILYESVADFKVEGS